MSDFYSPQCGSGDGGSLPAGPTVRSLCCHMGALRSSLSLQPALGPGYPSNVVKLSFVTRSHCLYLPLPHWSSSPMKGNPCRKPSWVDHWPGERARLKSRLSSLLYLGVSTFQLTRSFRSVFHFILSTSLWSRLVVAYFVGWIMSPKKICGVLTPHL
jgi:hypothetical protein